MQELEKNDKLSLVKNAFSYVKISWIFQCVPDAIYCCVTTKFLKEQTAKKLLEEINKTVYSSALVFAANLKIKDVI